MKKKIVSVIVILVILVVIAGIWVFKNLKRHKEANDSNEIINEDFQMAITTNFNIEKLKSYKLPIIIDFGADECIPCKQMEPALKQVNKELQGKAIIKFIDVWRYPNLADGYPIELIPTQIFFNSDGNPYSPQNADELGLQFITDNDGNHTLTIHVGALTVDEMKSMLKEMGLNE